MTKKYELIVFKNDFITDRRGYYQIKALRDIPRHGVKAGDLGGFVSGDHHLSQEGDCWISQCCSVLSLAVIEGNAIIRNKTIIGDKARVSGNAVIDNSGVWKDCVITDDAVVSDCYVTECCIVRGNSYVEKLYLKGRCVLSGMTNIVHVGDKRATVSYVKGEITQKDFLIQGPALSSDRYSFGYRTPSGVIKVMTGCFHGTLDEYLCAIEKTHKDNPKYLAQYRQFHQNFVKHFSQ